MKISFSEKTETPAVSLLMKPDNVVKESKVRRLFKKVAPVLTWPMKHPLTSLFLAVGPALAPWVGPLGSVLGGLAGMMGFGIAVSIADSRRCADRLFWGLIVYTALTLGSAIGGACLAFNAAPMPDPDAIVQRGCDALRAQYEAGAQELVSPQTITKERAALFHWGYYEDIVTSFALQADAANARPIDGEIICWENNVSDQNVFETRGPKRGPCPVLVRQRKGSSVLILNKENGAKKDGLTVTRGGQTYALPVTVTVR